MNPEIKSQWIAALRSGGYVQGMGALRRRTSSDTEYCCLGVLCDLYFHRHHNCDWRNDGLGRGWLTGGRSVNVLTLPDEVVSWAGLPDSNPLIDWASGPEDLAMVNDSGSSFDAIADAIESQL